MPTDTLTELGPKGYPREVGAGGKYSQHPRSRRPKPLGTRKYDITMIWDKEREIARRLTLGQKNVQIARELNCTAQEVTIARHSPVMQPVLAALHDERDAHVMEVKKVMNEAAPAAIRLMRDMVEDRNVPAADRIRAAKDLLDRAGFAPVQRSVAIHGTMTSDDLSRIKERALKMGVSLDTNMRSGLRPALSQPTIEGEPVETAIEEPIDYEEQEAAEDA